MYMEEAPITEEISDKKKKRKEEKAEKEEMSAQRTLLAYERTLLAWVRTGTHLMTFGFAIFKLLSEKAKEQGDHPLLQYISPKFIGMVMIVSGFIGLTLAVRRQIQIVKKYGQLEAKTFYSPAMLQAYVVMALCLLMMIGAAVSK